MSRRPPPPLVALPAAGPELALADRLAAYLDARSPDEERLHLELLAAVPGRARGAVVAAVGSGRWGPDRAEPLFVALGRVGWSGVRAGLEAVVGDRHAPVEARELALRLLALREVDRAPAWERRDSRELAAELLAGVVAAGDGGEALLEYLRLSGATVRASTVALLEEVRRAERVAPSEVWAAAVRSEEIVAEHPELVEALVEEGSPAAEAALEAARDRASPTARPALERALLHLRTARIEGGAPVEALDEVRARVSAADGSGVFQVIAAFPTRPGVCTVVGLSVRAGGDVRDRGVYPSVPEEQRSELLHELSARAGLPAVDVPVAVAAALVEAAVERTLALGRELPPDARPAVALLSGLTPQREAPAPPAPGAAPGLLALRRLLADPWYDSWSFELGDLRVLGVTEGPEAPRASETRAWAREAAARAPGTPVVARVVEACRHQAWWLAAVGDRAAATFARIADDLARARGGHPLVQVLVERSAPVFADDGMVVHYGDDALRSVLRELLPGLPAQPRARDLARLDLAEVGVGGLDAGVRRIEAGRRPRAAEVLELAVRLADAAVEAERAGGGARDAAPMLLAGLEARGLDPADAAEVATVAIDWLETFRAHVCPTCPERCWEQPSRSRARAFRAPGHPAHPEP